jgi:hypothetical protein
MPADALLVLQASTTKTSTFNGTALDIKGTPRRNLYARIEYSAATNASGSNTVAFSIEASSDNSTFYTIGRNSQEDIALSTTAQAKVFFIPFETDLRYVRLTATISGGGSTPTVTYQAEVMIARP